MSQEPNSSERFPTQRKIHGDAKRYVATLRMTAEESVELIVAAKAQGETLNRWCVENLLLVAREQATARARLEGPKL